MPAVSVKVFGGMLPAVDDRLLPDTAASYAQNCWLYDGSLNGLPTPKVLHTLDNPFASTVFRLPQGYSNTGYLYDSFWMEFENPNTNVVRASVFDDTFDRYYWASTDAPPMYNTRARIENGDDPWLLGIPAPASISVGHSGGVGAAAVRTYGLTRVSAYGEEGAMIVSAATTGKIDDTWAITIPAVGASDDGGAGDDRYITHTRIYRTVVGTSGVATYFLVAEVVGSTTSYNDTATDAVVSANAQNESLAWTEPPADLEGFVAMPNGILAAWRGNEIWFSEPYRPHAWPVAYVLTVEFPIVGMGVNNQTLVVATSGYPVTISGSHPSFMTASKLNAFEPCNSRRSIISAPEGVYYTSPNGLVLVTPGQAQNITKDLIQRDKWQQLTKLTNFCACRLGTAYYAFGAIQQGVFDEDSFDTSDATGSFEEEDVSGSLLGILIDTQNARVGFNLMSSEEEMVGILNDPWSGEVFYIRNGDVEWLDQGDVLAVIEEYTWRSKVFQSNKKTNFSAMKVYFQAPDTLNVVDYGVIRVYADGRNILEHNLVTSGELIRLPSGFKADYYQFELEAAVKVYNVQMATSAKELLAA